MNEIKKKQRTCRAILKVPKEATSWTGTKKKSSSSENLPHLVVAAKVEIKLLTEFSEEI